MTVDKYPAHLCRSTYNSRQYLFPDTPLPSSPSLGTSTLYSHLRGQGTYCLKTVLYLLSNPFGSITSTRWKLPSPHQTCARQHQSGLTDPSNGQNSFSILSGFNGLDLKSNTPTHHSHFSKQEYTMFHLYLYKDVVQMNPAVRRTYPNKIFFFSIRSGSSFFRFEAKLFIDLGDRIILSCS